MHSSQSPRADERRRRRPSPPRDRSWAKSELRVTCAVASSRTLSSSLDLGIDAVARIRGISRRPAPTLYRCLITFHHPVTASGLLSQCEEKVPLITSPSIDPPNVV